MDNVNRLPTCAHNMHVCVSVIVCTQGLWHCRWHCSVRIACYQLLFVNWHTQSRLCEERKLQFSTEFALKCASSVRTCLLRWLHHFIYRRFMKMEFISIECKCDYRSIPVFSSIIHVICKCVCVCDCAYNVLCNVLTWKGVRVFCVSIYNFEGS